MTVAYRIELAPDDNDTFLVTCPALPSLTTYGETEEEAIYWAHDAAYCRVYKLVSDFQDIPPSDAGPEEAHAVRFGALMSLRLELHQLLRELGLPRVELAKRLHWHPQEVNALFNLEDSSGLEPLEAAFRALGRAVDVSVREIAAPAKSESRKARKAA